MLVIELGRVTVPSKIVYKFNQNRIRFVQVRESASHPTNASSDHSNTSRFFSKRAYKKESGEVNSSIYFRSIKLLTKNPFVIEKNALINVKF